MDKSKYHHGSLKSDLMEKGLQLLSSAGYEAFSIRKVADMCGVSHAAPYRHFKSKEELISAITMTTSQLFISAIEVTLSNFEGNCKKQIIEAGKTYVKFMVENPDHFKFIFLTNHNNPILIQDSTFIQAERWPVNIFKKLFTSYRKGLGLDETGWSLDALALWTLVHGITVLLISNTIACEGDYQNIVSEMISKRFQFIS